MKALKETPADANHGARAAASRFEVAKHQAITASRFGFLIAAALSLPLLAGRPFHPVIVLIGALAAAVVLAAGRRADRLERAMWLSQARAGIIQALHEQRRQGDRSPTSS